jgi:Ca-activated chloride channel family protein
VSFELPLALLGLLLVPLVLALYLISQRRRRRYAVRFTNLDLLGSVVTKSPGIRRHLPPLLFLLALAALTMAVARPHVKVDVAREEATVMLVSDSSGSMQASDISPNRLAAAKEAGKTFADRLPDKFRLGFVTFNNVASLLVPPTSDREPVKQAIDSLQAEGGTAIGSGLEAGLTGLQPVIQKERAEARAQAQEEGRRARRRSPPAVIVLLSDGYSTTGPNPMTVARRARDLRVPVNTVALGTSAATVTLSDRLGTTRTVRVPPDRETLRRIARTTGGQYFDAADEKKLASVYDRLGSRIGFRKEKREYTAAFAAGGLGLMLAGGLLSMMWFGRLP